MNEQFRQHIESLYPSFEVLKSNSLRQALLEMYAVVALAAPYKMTSTTIEGALLFSAFRVFRGRAFVSDLEP